MDERRSEEVYDHFDDATSASPGHAKRNGISASIFNALVYFTRLLAGVVIRHNVKSSRPKTDDRTSREPSQMKWEVGYEHDMERCEGSVGSKV